MTNDIYGDKLKNEYFDGRTWGSGLKFLRVN